MNPALSVFHPSIQNWFGQHFDGPTVVQTESWPAIARGEHALITAPTGSGKTLTAFLWSLSQFASGAYPVGQTSVLYISPLKALNNDIQRNLATPLAELRSEHEFPSVQVAIRSGDTDQSQRQRMLRQPPDILITTPESLSLMLTTIKGRQALSHVRTLILDEIHSIVDNRRGAQLMVNIERLSDLAGEFQRLALSATARPLDLVADFVAGRDMRGQVRPIEIIDAPQAKELQFRVRFPAAAQDANVSGKKLWEPLSEDFRQLIDGNQSTLFFTNSRRLAEKITLKINEPAADPIAYAHHGSLAREVRNEVEQRLKGGELKAIVATNSLEMGIDVGHLDEVVLVQSPPSVASALQRIGRAGHNVNEVSLGTLYPTHAQDFLEAAVLADAIAERDLEPLQPLQAPLDVLAQIIISISATEPWPVADLYQLITRATPYANLAREQFDLVIEMLSGRYSGSRIRELKPRLTHDRIEGTVHANRGALLALYSSGGSIPDRGYFKLRHVDTGGIIGELDEEFVWEATVGDKFTLGTRHWQIHRITHNDVIVRDAPPGASTPPFWRNEFFGRSWHFSARIGTHLEQQEEALRRNARTEQQQSLESAGFESLAASELLDFLEDQRQHTDAPLPHRHHLLLELVRAGPAGYRGPDDPRQLVIHTYWGARLNQPFALALRAAWQRKYGSKLDIHADNNAVVLQCKGDPDPHDILSLVTVEQLPELLRISLESSGFFGARFRECAGRALLLTRQRFNQRLPLWMSRMQAKKLMSEVKSFSDFPVMLETWRTCLDDEFDLPHLRQVLEEIHNGTIRWTYVTTATPSPFARDLTFAQVSRYMYADDTPEGEEVSALNADLIAQAVHDQALRPLLRHAVVTQFEAKRQRHSDGYAPDSAEDWAEWLKERILLPADEFPADLQQQTFASLIKVGSKRWFTHRELVWGLHQRGLLDAAPPDNTPVVDEPRNAIQICREILSFYGPRTAEEIENLLPRVPADLLSEDETFVQGRLSDAVPADAVQWCDADNLEILLRMQRAQQRPNLNPQPATRLPAFLARLHQMGAAKGGASILFALESLRGYSAPVATWLHDLLAARIAQASSADLETAIEEYGLQWRGTGKQQIALGYREDLLNLDTDATATSNPLTALFTDPTASYSFQQLADRQSLSNTEFNESWWQAVWDGELSCDGLQPLQNAHERRYKVADLAAAQTSRRRLARAAPAWRGQWHLCPPAHSLDPLSVLEEDKELVRSLLDRYGILSRELVVREALQRYGQPWRWRHAFRALRIMELAGEVLVGQFFTELSTPQFATPAAYSLWQLLGDAQIQNGDDVFWTAAHDPVAPCGLGLDWPQIPHRRLGNYLAFHDGSLALVVGAGGRNLDYYVAPEHPQIHAINSVLAHLVDTLGQRVTILTINDTPARSSPYLAPLQVLFEVVSDHKSVGLQSRHR